MGLVEEVAHNTEDHHDDHTVHGVAGGVGAHEADDGDGGDHVLDGHRQDLHDEGDHAEGDGQGEDVGNEQGGDEAPGEVGGVGEQQRTGVEAPHHQTAQQHGAGAGAGDTEGQQGGEGTGGGSIIGGLAGSDTLHRAGAEGLLTLEALLSGVAQEGGSGGAGAGQHAHEGAQEAGPDGHRQQAAELVTGEHTAPEGQLVLGHLGLLIPVHHEADDLGEAHGTDDEGHEGDAAHEVDVAEVEAGAAGEGVHADGGQDEAQQGGDGALDGVVAQQPADGGEGHDHQGGHLGRAELQAHVSQSGTGEGQDDHTDGTADAGGHVGRQQGLTGLALLGHGVAVQGSHDGGGVAGDVQQDGGECAAVHVGVVEGAQHDDGRRGLELVGQGQQQGAAGQRADAGHGAHDQTQDGAQQAHAQVHGGEHRAEAGEQHLQIFHSLTSFNRSDP